MIFINPSNPVYNTIIFYTLLMVIILIMKPKIMYSDINKKFKAFGCGNEQTIVSLPFVGLSSAIFLYFIFLMIEVLNNYIDKD